MNEILGILYETIINLTWLEIVAFSSGLAYVILAAKESIWCWGAGLINVVAFFAISFYAMLYSDMMLQVFYFGLTLYGIYKWFHVEKNLESEALKITITDQKTWFWLSFFVVVSTVLQGILLDTYTPTDVPYLDAFTTSGSLAATWLVAHKKLENWLVWLLINPIYVGLYFYKGWILSSFLFVVYLIVAIFGYFSWRKTYLKTAT
ncbi:MAG: nicotinamide riboside transporter PnuC [Chitinophagales bacterium]